MGTVVVQIKNGPLNSLSRDAADGCRRMKTPLLNQEDESCRFERCAVARFSSLTGTLYLVVSLMRVQHLLSIASKTAFKLKADWIAEAKKGGQCD